MNKYICFKIYIIVFTISLFISCMPRSVSNSSDINSDNNIPQDKTEIFEHFQETNPDNNIVQNQTETIISSEETEPLSQKVLQVIPIHSKPVISFEGLRDTWNKTSYNLLSDEVKRQRFTMLIAEEMNKYPKEYFNKININTIVIVENLKFDNDYRAAVPDNYSGILFIGIRNDYSDDYIRHVYHHEQHHYAEYSIWKNYRYDWAPWRKLFDGVGGGGETAYQGGEDRTAILHRSGLTGFLNTYSTYGQEEDRAEMTAFFLTNHQYRLFIEKAKSDNIFYEKAILLFTLFKEELNFDLLELFYSRIRE